jgi:hypothetical protein
MPQCENSVAFFRHDDDNPWSLDCEREAGHDGAHQMHAPEFCWDDENGGYHETRLVKINWQRT